MMIAGTRLKNPSSYIQIIYSLVGEKRRQKGVERRVWTKGDRGVGGR